MRYEFPHMKKLLLVLLVILIAAYWYFRHHRSSSHTHHAWDESVKILPAGLTHIGDLEAARFGNTPLAIKLIAKAAGDDSVEDIEGWVRKLRGTCKLDVLHAVDSFVVAVPKDGGYFVITALDRLDRSDIDGCMKKLSATITELDHGIVRYTGATERPFTLRWFDDQLFAFGLFEQGFNDHDEFLKLTSGGFDKDKDMNKLASKIDRSWTGWVIAREAPLDNVAASGVFSVVISGNDVSIVARAFADDLGPVKSALDDLVALAKHFGADDPRFAEIVAALHVESDKDSAAITATVSDDAIVRLLFPAN